jgi:hypothetical protein
MPKKHETLQMRAERKKRNAERNFGNNRKGGKKRHDAEKQRNLEYFKRLTKFNYLKY